MEDSIRQANINEVGTSVISTEALFDHWQGHRRLSRRVIEAFPEDKIYNYSIGGMRPFSQLIMEIIGLSAPGILGITTGKWVLSGKPVLNVNTPAPATKKELLELWDWVTQQIDTFWPQIPPHRFQETDIAFGQYEGTIYSVLLYLIDNEIHHRGQATVYLRSLGIEPPAFWDRS